MVYLFGRIVFHLKWFHVLLVFCLLDLFTFLWITDHCTWLIHFVVKYYCVFVFCAVYYCCARVHRPFLCPLQISKKNFLNHKLSSSADKLISLCASLQRFYRKFPAKVVMSRGSPLDLARLRPIWADQCKASICSSFENVCQTETKDDRREGSERWAGYSQEG